MDVQKYLLDDEGSPDVESTAGQLFRETLKSVPSAAAELAREAWDKPLETGLHVVATVGGAAAVGSVLGAFIPSKGPAELIAGAVFTLPILMGEYSRVRDVYKRASLPGANMEGLGHELARGTVSDAGNIGLCFAGGHLGGKLGHRIAGSNTKLGESLQDIQRSVLRGENRALLAVDALPELFTARKVASIEAQGLTTPAVGPGAQNGQRRAWFASTDSPLSNRIAQVQATEAGAGKLAEYYGQVHGHSRYSDGMGEPIDIYKSAKTGGQKFYSITDHNHLAARDGVKTGDGRKADQAGTPILAADPALYVKTFADAAAVTEAEKFVGLVGVEMGTIGKVGGGKKPGGATKAFDGHDHGLHDHSGHGHDGHDHSGAPPQITRVFQPDGKVLVHPVNGGPEGASGLAAPVKFNAATAPATIEMPILDVATREATHYGGVNHINLFEVPAFFEAVRQPKPKTVFGRIAEPFRSIFGAREATELKAPDVVRYNDGDYKSMVDHLDKLTDTTGKRPIIQLNHPRFRQDFDERLDPSVRGRDYGIKSFKNFDEWRQRFGKYASQIEVITGEALNPNDTPRVKSQDLGPVNLAGYIDKGLHLSPTFGRDDHFARPNASPAGTGILAKSLTKDSILDAMRERRTVATTSTELLRGHMVANDAHMMGSILDQAAVNDLRIKMNIGGKLEPTAKYKVTLWGDEKIGDGALAQPVQVKELIGSDLVDTQGQVMFDQVRHKIGNSSAWYVEVQRTDPKTANVDYLWTAPVWVEPRATQHSFLTRGLVSTGSLSILGFN